MNRSRRHLIDPYLNEGEEIVLVTRQHAWALLAAFVEAIMFLVPMELLIWGIAGIELLANPVGDWIIRLTVLAMVAVVVRLFWKILHWELARFAVTTDKIVFVHGVLNRKVASTPLVKLSEVSVVQPLFGRIFGYGSLVLDAQKGDGVPLHGLTHIPDPARMYRVINNVARRERTLEGGGRLNTSSSENADTLILSP